MIWFTSDTHYNHKNSIDRWRFGFSSIEDMNNRLVESFNSVLTNHDTLYHLGDIALDSPSTLEFLERLKIKQIHLIWGNHDDTRVKHQKLVWTGDLKYIKIDDTKLMLSHYPMESWRNSHHGSLHLHGHTHGDLPPKGRRMDVGVDTNNFMPYSFDEVRGKLEAREIIAHHLIKEKHIE